jgi:hypothetical protein
MVKWSVLSKVLYNTATVGAKMASYRVVEDVRAGLLAATVGAKMSSYRNATTPFICL